MIRATLSLSLTVLLALTLTTPAANAQQAEVRWVPALPSQYQGYFSLGLFPDGTGFAHRGNSSDSGPLFRTHDFGESWELATVPASRSTPSMAFATPSRLYTIGFGGDTFVSEDAGDSWTELTLPITDSSTTAAVEAADAQTLAIGIQASVEHDPSAECPTDPLSDTVDLLITHDRGQTWESRDVQERPGMLGAIALVPAPDPVDERLAVITSDWTYTQTGSCSFGGSATLGDRVVTWVPEETGGGSFVEIVGCASQACVDLTWLGDVLVVLYNGGDIVRYTATGEELSRTSLDGVITATTGVDTAQAVAGIEFADDQVGYASLNGGGVWRTTDGGVSWVNELSPQEVIGVGIGSVAVADADHVLSGGPTTVNRRVPDGLAKRLGGWPGGSR